MANLGNVVYLSEAQRQELVDNGTITVDGNTITYNENDVYVVPEPEWRTVSNVITTEETDTITINTDSDGQPFSFAKVRIHAIFPPNSSAGTVQLIFDDITNSNSTKVFIGIANAITTYKQFLFGKIEQLDGYMDGLLTTSRYDYNYTSQVIGTTTKSTPITEIKLYSATASVNFPVGTNIVIEGLDSQGYTNGDSEVFGNE